MLRRGALLLVVLAILLFACGCEPKLYYFSFEDEQQLDNEEGSWMVSVPGNYAFADDGIALNTSMIYGPHKYKGDFKFTLEFKLDTGEGTPALMVFMADEPTAALFVGNMLGIGFYDIGEAAENFMVLEHAEGHSNTLPFDIDIPGLVNVGENALCITKTDDHINFKLNESVLYDYDLQYYASEWFCPHLIALTPSSSLIIRSCNIEYQGSRTEM